jgi:TetR/AcrR family transcriptional regulator, acrAB operon repressor
MVTEGAQTQSQDSRDEILKAAIQLFANRGFHETSMSEVAREAKVSKALIFWHFKTKEELFLAVLNKLLEPYVIDFAEESEKLDEREQIRKLIGGYVNFVRENAGSVSFFLRRFMNGEEMPDAFTDQIRRLYDLYQALLTDRIRLAQEKGLCSRSYEPAVMANFVLAALNGLLINLLFMSQTPFDLDGALAMLHGLLFGDTSNPQRPNVNP